MSERQGSQDRDRREFFRIDDAVRVSLRRVPRDELDQRLERQEQVADGSFTVMAGLAAISSRTALYLRRVEHELPDVAAYLKGIDQKLELLGRAVLAQDTGSLADQVNAVNLSAGGMSLDAAESFGPNTPVEIRLLLFPSYTGLLIYGEVVGSEPLPGAEQHDGLQYRVRVEFTHIRDQDRDILIRHILRRQGDELRSRRSGG